MSFLTRQHNQTATLWTSGGVDSVGDPTFGTPSQVSCRWEQRAEAFTDTEGVEHVSRHIVYLGADVVVGDYLFLGTSVGVDPSVIFGAERVQEFKKIPNLAADDFERRALL